MDIVYLKLNNGDDIIGRLLPSDDESYCIDNPLHVRVHPIHGMFAKSWLLLSVETTVVLHTKDILFFGEANEKAKLYYSTFLDKLEQVSRQESDDEESSDQEMRDDIESRLLAMIEADTSTKH